MLNFKSLLLTTLAALGLAANVQACKDCRLLVYGPTEQTKEIVLYARKNADALLKEYEAVVNDPKTVDLLRAKALDVVDSGYAAIAHVTKGTRSAQEVIMDPKTAQACETLLNKLLDFHGFADTMFTYKQTPTLNTLAHKAFAQSDKYRKEFLQTFENAPKREIAAQLSPRFQDFRKTCIAFEQERPNAAKVVDTFLSSFITGNKALLLELGQALHGILKDDSFFAEIEKNQPDHKLPKTASVLKLQEVLHAFELQVVTFIKIISATSKSTNTK
jgi:hypothetical protein